jgi:hypothetical protein
VVPVPIHRDCNPTVTCHKPEQVYSCAFARLSWALWLSDPGKHRIWDRYLAESEELQPFGVALAKANELCDISGFGIRQEDAVLNARIASGVKISAVTGKAKVPALMLDQGILHGHVQDLAALVQLLEPHLRGPKAAHPQVVFPG